MKHVHRAITSRMLRRRAARKPDLCMKVAFSGEFRCVLNEGTDHEVDTGWFKNLITDIGLDRIAVTSPQTLTWGSIGTGTNAPANSDTSLQAWVASSNNRTVDSQTNVGASTYAAQTQMHWVYAQGAVVGNMAEIGVGWATGGGSLWSRARILDGGGSPTTLTVVALDQLTVYYKVTCTPQITDLTGTVSISGTTYNYTGRIANATLFANGLQQDLEGISARWAFPGGAGGFAADAYSTQTLGAITSNPTGAASHWNAGLGSIGSYTPGQKYLDGTFTAAPSEGNASGGIGSVVLYWQGAQAQFQYSLANASGGTAVPKDNTKTFTLVARFAWDRV